VLYKLLNNNPIVLQMQEELKKGMTLEETAAGSQLSADLDAMIKKHEAEIKKVREELQKALEEKDKAWQKKLNDELAKLREEITKLAQSKEKLKKRPYVALFRHVRTSLKL
jgi:Skp family chaperone for outer membrane proteins